MPFIKSINYLHTTNFAGQVADGTTEGDEETYSPNPGEQWELRSVRLNIPNDGRGIVHLSHNRIPLEEFHGHNLPANPDLIPLGGSLVPDDKLSIACTNNTGAAADFTVEVRYEVTVAGGG